MIDCRINGVSYDMTRNYYISEQIGNKTATEVDVLVKNQAIPKAGDLIEIVDTSNQTILFWGICGIPRSPSYKSLHDAKIYSIVCENANAILSNRVINCAYQGYTVTQIVNDLFSRYISAEGITVGTISDIDVVLEVYTAKDFNLQDAINELADLVGATWNITNDKEFSFVVSEDFATFPHTIDRNFLIGGNLSHDTHDYKTRTVQYITGASDMTSPQTELFIYDNASSSFSVAFGLALKPVIKINGATVPQEKIGVVGINDDDEQIAFTFAYNSTTVQYRSESELLTAGDEVAIIYTGLFPIRIVSYNDSKVEEIAKKTGTSGLREQVYIANDVKTATDARRLADSLLEQFSEATEEVNFFLLSNQLYGLGMTLEDVGLLTTLKFDLPEIGIVGDFLITERKLEPAYADMTQSERKYKVTIKAMSRNYLKSYGETISALYRDISQLRIREDDVVISDSRTTERMRIYDRTVFGTSLSIYPTNQVFCGSLVRPMSFGRSIYPVAGG